MKYLVSSDVLNPRRFRRSRTLVGALVQAYRLQRFINHMGYEGDVRIEPLEGTDI